MSKQEVILCESLETSLGRAIELCPHDKLFVLTDEHTQRLQNLCHQPAEGCSQENGIAEKLFKKSHK